MQDRAFPKLTRVGIASEEPLRMAGFSSVFENQPFLVLSHATLDQHLMDRSLSFLILDLTSDHHWIETQYRVGRLRPDLRLIVLGPNTEDESIIRSILAGARAYLDPGSGPMAVRMAVKAVVGGTIWAPRIVLTALIDRLMQGHGIPENRNESPTELSPRERQVLDLILVARSNREIAEELGIEERTVKAYVASLMRKNGVDNRVSLTVRALQGHTGNSKLLY